jgi:hypothetical protein
MGASLRGRLDALEEGTAIYLYPYDPYLVEAASATRLLLPVIDSVPERLKHGFGGPALRELEVGYGFLHR